MTDIIDVSAWSIVPWQGDSFYPKGASQKYLVQDEDDNKCLFKGSWKRERENYIDAVPFQFWCEYITAKIGEMMGMQMADTSIAINHASTEVTVGTIIKWFGEHYTGLEILTNKIQNYCETDHELASNLQYTEDIPEAKTWWMQLMLFDTLIGNSDRHYENWAILKDNHVFTPIYDSGLALGWRVKEEELDSFKHERHFNQYQCKMKIFCGYGKKPKDIINYLIKEVGIEKSKITQFLNQFDCQKLADKYNEHFKNINKQLQLDYQLTAKRQDFIFQFLQYRHEQLYKLVEQYE